MSGINDEIRRDRPDADPEKAARKLLEIANIAGVAYPISDRMEDVSRGLVLQIRGPTFNVRDSRGHA